MSNRRKDVKNGRGTVLYISDDNYISVGKQGEYIAIRGGGKVHFFDTWNELMTAITLGEKAKKGGTNEH